MEEEEEEARAWISAAVVQLFLCAWLVYWASPFPHHPCALLAQGGRIPSPQACVHARACSHTRAHLTAACACSAWPASSLPLHPTLPFLLSPHHPPRPACAAQVDRLQRSVNNQEMRMEGMVIVLRDIENLLRNQQPVLVHQEARPAVKRCALGARACVCVCARSRSSLSASGNSSNYLWSSGLFTMRHDHRKFKELPEADRLLWQARSMAWQCRSMIMQCSKHARVRLCVCCSWAASVGHAPSWG